MSAPLSAALIAGGKSTRLGRDKCLVEINGLPLWQRQLGVLATLSSDVMVIAPHPPTWLPGTVRWVADAAPNHGPLAGLAAALAAARNEHVVALAVDLPAMTADYLAALPRGSVPEMDGWFQPLCAIYPRAAGPVADRRLGSSDHSLQALVRELICADLIRAVPVLDHQRPLFRNLNAPGD